MQFDEFYQTIGVFGRYQKTKYFLICLTYMLPPVMVYSWTFTAATPSFQCRTPVDDLPGGLKSILQQHSIPSESQCRQDQSRISLDECQRCFQMINTTVNNPARMIACTNFDFNRTYYQSTLVEEVERD